MMMMMMMTNPSNNDDNNNNKKRKLDDSESETRRKINNNKKRQKLSVVDEDSSNDNNTSDHTDQILRRIHLSSIFVFNEKLHPLFASKLDKHKLSCTSIHPSIKKNTFHRKYTRTVFKVVSENVIKRMIFQKEKFQTIITDILTSRKWRHSIISVNQIPPTIWYSISNALLPKEIQELFPNLSEFDVLDLMLPCSITSIQEDEENNNEEDNEGENDEEEDEDKNAETIINDEIQSKKNIHIIHVGRLKLDVYAMSVLVYTTAFEYYLARVCNNLSATSNSSSSSPNQNDTKIHNFFDHQHLSHHNLSTSSLMLMDDFIRGNMTTTASEDEIIYHRRSNTIPTTRQTLLSSIITSSDDTSSDIGSGAEGGERVPDFVPIELIEQQLLNQHRTTDIDTEAVSKLYFCGKFFIEYNSSLSSSIDLLNRIRVMDPTIEFQKFQRDSTHQVCFDTFEDLSIDYVGFLKFLRRRLMDYESNDKSAADIQEKLKGVFDKISLQRIPKKRSKTRIRQSKKKLSKEEVGSEEQLQQQQQQPDDNHTSWNRKLETMSNQFQLFNHHLIENSRENVLGRYGISMDERRDSYPFHIMTFARHQVSPMRLFNTLLFFRRKMIDLTYGTHRLKFDIVFSSTLTRVSIPSFQYLMLKEQVIPWFIQTRGQVVRRRIPFPLFSQMCIQYMKSRENNPTEKLLSWMLGIKFMLATFRRSSNHLTEAMPKDCQEASVVFYQYLPAILRHYRSDEIIWDALVRPIKRQYERYSHIDTSKEISKESEELCISIQTDCLLTGLEAFGSAYCIHYMHESAFAELRELFITFPIFSQKFPMVSQIIRWMSIWSSGDQTNTNYIRIPFSSLSSPSGLDVRDEEVKGKWSEQRRKPIYFRENNRDFVPYHMYIYEMIASQLWIHAFTDPMKSSELVIKIFYSMRLSIITARIQPLKEDGVITPLILKQNCVQAAKHLDTLRKKHLFVHQAYLELSKKDLPIPFTTSSIDESNALYSLFRSLHVLSFFSTRIYPHAPKNRQYLYMCYLKNTLYDTKDLANDYHIITPTLKESMDTEFGQCVDIRESKRFDIKQKKTIREMQPLTLKNSMPLVREFFYENSLFIQQENKRYKQQTKTLAQSISKPFTFSPPDLFPLIYIHTVIPKFN